ncbi:hypothetical protein PPTG_23629 [Phytophthora nicotianae INRA-310]|uniref:Uncharacterized protein n=1 Tax=Phytophthora nicotianae (strain INRA-310) TaxID=761204 RepID=W2PVW0_PHYN3|nr:hypothetical protein PPTG_23629 [Phytophthora nicotianae INRA-310]ETN04160.1 hypothetical protein PPTG_23629 [Phytophthora nicotianae INRA-310]
MMWSTKPSISSAFARHVGVMLDGRRVVVRVPLHLSWRSFCVRGSSDCWATSLCFRSMRWTPVLIRLDTTTWWQMWSIFSTRSDFQ